MPERGSPKTRTVPEDGRRRPATTLRSVDLPQPVGPTTETNSPSPIWSVTSFTAVYEPEPARAANVLVMRSKSIATPIGLPRQDVWAFGRASALLLVFCRRLPDERLVERLTEIHLSGFLYRWLELHEDLVDVFRGLHRH